MKSNRVPAAALFIIVTGCASAGSSGTRQAGLDPAALQTYLQRNFARIPVLTEAMSRIVVAASGGNATGVTFTNITGGVQGTVGVDLDGNGSMESSIDATLMYDNPASGIGGGATFTVTHINAPYVSGTSTATVSVTGNGSQINFTSGSADLTPTYGPRVTVPSVAFTVSPTLTAPTIIGHADFIADNKTGTLFFESSTSTGWKIRVSSPDFPGFTVP
jgi:hypothetical protein